MRMFRELLQEILEAERRCREYIVRTPLEYSPYLSNLGQSNVYLKLENFQITGSFKIRGVINKILSLSEEEKRRGIIAASTGNHGVAVAYAIKKFGLRGMIFLPENVSEAKLNDILSYGVEVKFYGKDSVETEKYARKYAKKEGMIYISPYNDEKIIAGQGTIGVELLEQLKDVDVVFIPVGGGGLISGIAIYLKSMIPDVKIIGCQPENSPVMYKSIKAGKILTVTSKPTISEGTAGGIEEDAITFHICKELVDDFVLVSEEEILKAIRLMIEKHHILVEGAAALSIAAYMKKREEYRGKNIVLLVTGRRLSIEWLKKVVCK